MSHTEDVNRYYYEAARFGLSFSVARQILRDANALHRLAEWRCNWSELSERQEGDEKRRELKVRNLASEAGGNAEISGDPRGAVVKLWKWDGSPRGGFVRVDLAVPSRGYSLAEYKQIEAWHGARRKHQGAA